MKKIIASSLAALTFAGALAAVASPAEAASYRHYGHRGHHGHHGGNDAAVAIVAGVAGLALGSAISSSKGHSSSGYYAAPRGYYAAPYPEAYYYNDPRAAPPRYYQTCISRERVWDPYIERNVVIERRYAC